MTTPYDHPSDPAKRHSRAITDGPDRAGRSDARLYPGSWSEWSRKGLPAEKG